VRELGRRGRCCPARSPISHHQHRQFATSHNTILRTTSTNGKAHSRYTQNLSNTTMTTPRITKKGKRSSTIPLLTDHAQLFVHPQYNSPRPVLHGSQLPSYYAPLFDLLKRKVNVLANQEIMACRRVNGLGAGKRSTTSETGAREVDEEIIESPKSGESISPTSISSFKKRKKRVNSIMYTQHFKKPQVELLYQLNAFTVVAPVQTFIHCARHHRYTSSHIISAAKHSRRLVQKHPI